MDLITFNENGIYCPNGDFYIDPWKPVDKAIITHAHSDHARAGNRFYLCHELTKPLLQCRLGDNNYQSVRWNEPILINGVQVSLHPAGHIIGSSQVRLEFRGEVCVVSGDYKVEDDGISGKFEPIACHTFVTESTFGLPIFRWKSQQELFFEIQNWIIKTKNDGKNAVLIAYSLGKAQRILPCVAAVNSNIFVHGAVWNIHQALREAGVPLPSVNRVSPGGRENMEKGCVVIAPPGSEASGWLKKFAPYELSICSGWMQIRGNTRRSGADKGFPLSDHADWEGLLSSVKATGAQKVYVTHGFQSVFSRYLNELGIAAAEMKTGYGEEDIPSGTGSENELGEKTSNPDRQ